MLKPTLYILLVTTLIGCGGSSSSEKPAVETSNLTLTMSIADMSVIEKEVVTITPSLSVPASSIQKYEWAQTSGGQVELTAVGESNLVFTAPSLVQEEKLSFSLTVTDNSGSTATSSVDVTVNPNIVSSFTLSGLVTTGSLMTNAHVTVSLGELLFETQTNEIGRYTVLVNVDDDYQDNLLKASATGAATDSVLKLESIIGDVQTVSNLAAEYSNNLTHEELHSLLISNISTAASALMVQQNGDQEITSLEAYALSSKSFNSELLLPYASMIKFLFDNISNMPTGLMPAEFSNTYNFFTDKQKATDLYFALNRYDNSLLNELTEDLLEEKYAVATVMSLPVDEHYTNQGKLQFESDKTGVLTSSLLDDEGIPVGKKTFTWETTIDGLVVTFDMPALMSEKSNYVGGHGDITYKEYLNGYTFNWLFLSSNRNELLIERHREYRNSSTNEIIEIYDGTSAYSTQKQIVKDGSSYLTHFIEPNKKYVLELNLPVVARYIDALDGKNVIDTSVSKLSFSASTNNQVDIELFGWDAEQNFSSEVISAQWQIDDKGSLIVSSDDLNISIIGLTNAVNDSIDVMVLAEQDIDGKTVQRSAVSNLYKADEDFVWTEQNVPGIYIYPEELTDLSLYKFSWYELRADGTASYFNFSDYYDEGIIELEDVFESPGLWKIIDGKLVVRRYRHNADTTGDFSNCHSSIWDTSLDSDCLMYIERTWEPVQDTTEYSNNQNTVIQRLNYYWDYSRSRIGSANNAGEHLLRFTNQIITGFIKAVDRPVELPEGYVLIKDRTSEGNVNIKVTNEELQISELID